MKTPGETGFTFTMEAHREIELASRDDLMGLVRDVRGALAARTYPVTKEQVRTYVRARLTLGDQDWERAQAEDTAKRWLKKLSV